MIFPSATEISDNIPKEKSAAITHRSMRTPLTIRTASKQTYARIPTFTWCKKAEEGIPTKSEDIHTITLAKEGTHIRLWVDDRKVIDWTDEGKVGGQPHGDGIWLGMFTNDARIMPTEAIGANLMRLPMRQDLKVETIVFGAAKVSTVPSTKCTGIRQPSTNQNIAVSRWVLARAYAQIM